MKDDELMKNKIRSVLIELRTERNLSQTEVGKIVGKSKTAVASWEQGLSMPDAVTLYHLARYYGKSIDYMYGDSDN
jgi:transcriptional regulator with XRE-family HTH domain